MTLNRRHCLGAAVGTAAALSASIAIGEGKPDKLVLAGADAKERMDTVRMFANRPALVDWVKLEGTIREGSIVTAAGLTYEYDGITTAISDMPGWKPQGSLTPDHFSENTTPGATDMSSALQAAINYSVADGAGSFAGQGGGTVWLKSVRYAVSSKVTVPGNGDYIGLVGDDGATIISNVDGPCLQVNDDVLFGGNDTVSARTVYGVRVENIRFIHSSAKSKKAIAIRAGRCPQLRISNCLFLNFWISLDGHRMNETLIEGNRFSAANRSVAAKAFIRLRGVYDSRNSHTPGGGIHVYENEFTGNGQDASKVSHCILINSVDGIYIDQCHFVHYQYGLTVEPLNSLQNYRITDVRVAQCYFDKPNKDGCNVSIQGTVGYGKAGENGLYQDIEFSDCLFRGANAARHGCVIDVSDGGGFKARKGGIENIKFVACSFRQHSSAAIQAMGAYDEKLEVIGLKVADSSFRDGNRSGSDVSYLNIDARSAIVTGNSFGQEIAAPNRCVKINLSDAGTDHASVILTGNDFSASTYSIEPFLVETKQGAFVSVSDNLTALPAQRRQGMYTAQTEGFAGSPIWDFTIGANATAANLNISVVGVEKSGGADNRVVTKYWACLHNSGGSLSIEGKSKEHEHSTFTSNAAPVAVVLMTGKNWSSRMPLSVGEVIVNSAGNAYLVVSSDGAAGGNEPVQTSGAYSDDGAQYVFIGEENAGKVVVFVSGEPGSKMNWAASVDFISVP